MVATTAEWAVAVAVAMTGMVSCLLRGRQLDCREGGELGECKEGVVGVAVARSRTGAAVCKGGEDSVV
jgi:hypothetical protein